MFSPSGLRRPRTALPRLAAVGVLLCAALVEQSSEAASDSITVPIGGLKSDEGQVGCLLFSSSDGFPSKPQKAAGMMFVKISSKSATCVFDNVKPGTYAIAAMHDENGNGKLDTNFLGIPREGTGASRDARGTMGAPKWADAVFQFAGGSSTIPVTIHY
jgi:uncharacterized protein (DUF2141 family)